MAVSKGKTWGIGALMGIVLGVVASAFAAATVHAHERWFVEEGTHAGEAFAPEFTVLAAIATSLGFLALALVFTHTIWYRRMSAVAAPAQRFLPEGMEWRLIALLAGIMLIADSINGVFLAPELRIAEGWLGLLALASQAFIGLLLLSQVSFALAGLLVLVAATPMALVAFSAGMLIDYLLEFGALGLALIFVGLSSCPDQLACNMMKVNPRRFSHLPLPIIRIGLGLSLIVLAVHNKLADPNFALTFLDEHDFNFVLALGFTGFSNLHFVFGAGLVELGLGVLLVAGVATRITAAVLFGFFLATLFALGLPELLGHLPLFAIALALVYRGPGQFGLESMWERTMHQKPLQGLSQG